MDTYDFEGKNFNKKSWKDYLKENDRGFRFLIGFICWICLALFFHFREIRVEALPLNKISGRYVVAQVDFEFPDEEAMVLLKQEETLKIGNIYEINAKLLRQIHYDFEYMLVHDPSWKKKIADVSLEKMYKISDGLKEILQTLHFTDENTENQMKKYKVPSTNFVALTLDQDNGKYFLPMTFWKNDFLDKKLLEVFPKENRKIFDFVIAYFKQKPFLLQKNEAIQEQIKDYITSLLPQRYSSVKTGSKIIAKGEKVGQKHITMLHAMKEALDKKRMLTSPFLILGNLLLALIFVLLSYLYLKIDQKSILKSLQKLSLLVCIVILTLAFAKVVEYLILQNTDTFLDKIRYPLIVPFASILIFMLFNSRMSLFGSSFLSIILGISLAVDHSRFLILNLIASLVVIVSTKTLRKRKEVFAACGKCLLGAIPVVIAFNFVSLNFGGSDISIDILACVIFMIVIAILIVGILPVLESLFNVMTDITIMEYMDPNNELLKRLTLEMPGTYQHALVLGSLSEIAAQAIGANGILCRVASLYHDIGKLTNAKFFTENQSQGVNIHQLLTPIESAQVIISHVKDGIMLAKKYRLPQPFIDIIEQHHGTTLVYFFYHKELELQGQDKTKVDETKFRYPGPKPQTKEAAIIMIADSIEAMSRSEEEVEKEDLKRIIEEAVKEKADDMQFDECDLSFKEIKTIKEVLLQTLIATRHVRIKYPEKHKD